MGCDDLLLNLRAERSWGDLLPVALELTRRHLALALVTHPSGLRLLGAPDRDHTRLDGQRVAALLEALATRFAWLVLDVPAVSVPLTASALPVTDALVLVTTADPAALRGAHRYLAGLPDGLRAKTGLVLNQITRQHPAQPGAVAASLGVPLLAVLPPDPRAVGYQVNFGQACALDRRSLLGLGVIGLADRLAGSLAPDSVGQRRGRRPPPTVEHERRQEGVA
jgi:Flp pilus assembly CpaE family ATPase